MKDETWEDLAAILCGHALNHFWPYCDWGKFDFAGCWVSEYIVLGEKCGLVRFHRTSFTGRRSSPCQVAHCKGLLWMFGLPPCPLPALWETHFKKALIGSLSGGWRNRRSNLTFTITQSFVTREWGQGHESLSRHWDTARGGNNTRDWSWGETVCVYSLGWLFNREK